MNRTDAALYLETQLGPVLTAVGYDLGDPFSALSDVLDDALLLFGVAYDSLATAEVSAADVPGFRAVLRVAGLRSAYDRALTHVDISVSDPSVSKQRSQLVAHLKEALAKAESDAAPYMASDATADFQSGSITYGPRTVPVGYEDASWLF